MSRSWQATCSHRPRRGFVVSQYELTQSRAFNAFCGAPVSNGRGISSDSMKLRWQGRYRNKGRAMFDQRLQVIFGNAEGAVE